MSALEFTDVFAQWPIFVKGIWLTCVLTAIGGLIGTLVGTLVAWALLDGPRGLKVVLACYVELFRNTPFIVQIFFIFFGLSSVGLKMDALTASLVAIVLNLGAYACEIVRAGMQATPKGQVEAEQSMALSRWQIFSRVIIPPALARVWPALTSQLVIIMLATSVCSQISADEVSYAANFVAGKTFRSFESFAVVTLVYLVLSIALRKLLTWAGPRFIFGQVKF